MSDTSKNRVAVTTQYEFHNATPDGEKLFSIRAGIPLVNAFEQLSILIGSASGGVDCAMPCNTLLADTSGGLSQSVQMLEFASALVESMHMGLLEHQARDTSAKG